MATVELDRLAVSAGEWAAVAFAAGPADRPRAEAGIRAAYRAAGLAEPTRILWARSPREGAVFASLLTDPERSGPELRAAGLTGGLEFKAHHPGACVRDVLLTRPWEAARTAKAAELGPRGWPRAWSLAGGRLWEPVSGLVGRIRRGIADAESPEYARRLRRVTLDAVLGQHEAPWLATFEGLYGEAVPDVIAALAEVARSAGWWWPYERVAIVCERPAELHRDEPGRLHRGDGPALSYPDGFSLYAWRGMPVPPGFIAGLDGLTAKRIMNEENAELRRVMLEYYGYDRYLADLGATPAHRDETGVLWRIDLPGDEPVVMVEVVNSTAEPDGTFRTYWLRVPPATRSAREGVAWTFGVDAADYRPERET
ncbi:DUF6745 domain-containing protein [Rhizohabitans arisaemae]|uniref:DUF6745 domain-containing protein n=1 Tax=Rhizohabitans arisaemae TaxID=2720610 RepID=UPI0024B24BAD|nr:hypothetical protein [Rhizohabitans arisaemae]